MISCELVLDLYTTGTSGVGTGEHVVVDLHHIKEWLQMGSLCIQSIFVIEIATKLLVYGQTFFRSKHNIFDLIIISISWSLSIVFIHHKYLHYTEAIIFVRIWNILRIIYGEFIRYFHFNHLVMMNPFVCFHKRNGWSWSWIRNDWETKPRCWW